MAETSLKTFCRLRYWYAWPLLALILTMSWMPSRLLWLLGNAFGWFFYWMPSPSVRIAVKNLEICFPDMSQPERLRLLKRHFRLCGFAVLSLCVVWWAPRWRLRRFVQLRDKHHLDNAVASGKNVILLAPHFIGLDMGGVRLSMDKKYVSMYRKSRNPLLEYLFQRRGRFGGLVVERMASLKPILRCIREHRPFYYLPDQDMGERASIFVPFFRVPAATVTSLSRIAQSTNAVVVPCITRILPAGAGFEVNLHAPLENFPTADPVADATRMNLEIEKWVRLMPDQYMWSYRRFKTRPNNEPTLYE